MRARRSARRVARPPRPRAQPLPALRSSLQPAGLIGSPTIHFNRPIGAARCAALYAGYCSQETHHGSSHRTYGVCRRSPWHGLGNRLSPKQPLEVWQREAGMDWQIQESPVHFKADAVGHLGSIHSFRNRRCSTAPIPRHRSRWSPSATRWCNRRRSWSSTATSPRSPATSWKTAGVLKGGRKFWAPARTGQNTSLKGNDLVNGYLLLATSCDGTLATTATPTTVRVVCNNTLTIAVDGATRAIKVPHSTRFDAQAVKKQLSIAVSQWDEFMYRMRHLAERKVQWHEAMGYFMQVLCDAQPNNPLPDALPNERALRRVQSLYEGRGRGSQLEAANGTAWGLLNAVTEYVDHERRARSNEYRMDSAWFGQGAVIKQRALDAALQLVA
ncbi:DUF932 domain-containing protein [Pseudomonas aeruginosa]|nr:DUF932 domain-containing protein [Pseudomonas aeruginosa]